MSFSWSKEQTRVILQSVVGRLNKDKKSFSVKLEAGDITLSNHQLSDSVFISIKSDYIYIAIGNHTGSYNLGFFWQDKDIKSLVGQIKEIASAVGTTPSQTIYKIFPEAIAQEFETQVLEVKVGKE